MRKYRGIVPASGRDALMRLRFLQQDADNGSMSHGAFDLPPTIADAIDSAWDGHSNGTALLREAHDLLKARELAAALDHCKSAHGAGLPVELLPHYHALSGSALQRAGRHSEAIEILEDGWREYPDFAALSALLGVSYHASGRTGDASRALFASVIADDPDQSLARYRQLLSGALRLVTAAHRDAA